LSPAQDFPQAGGYLTAADDVVQAFHLPKYQHAVAAYSTDSPASGNARDGNKDATQNTMEPNTVPITLGVLDDDDIEMEEITSPQFQARADNKTPITIRELAHAARQRSVESEDPSPSTIQRPTTANMVPRIVSTNGAASSSQCMPLAKLASKPRGSARKRPRNESEQPERGKADSPSVNAPMPTRVLRPRAAKSAAHIQEEREREQTYRRAVAD
jgi:xeroderma pigmentosum group C-complementing protein